MDLAPLRKNMKLTQAEFAARIGTTKMYVGHLESGRRKPSLKLAKRIEDVTGAYGFVAAVVAEKVSA